MKPADNDLTLIQRLGLWTVPLACLLACAWAGSAQATPVSLGRAGTPSAWPLAKKKPLGGDDQRQGVTFSTLLPKH